MELLDHAVFVVAFAFDITRWRTHVGLLYHALICTRHVAAKELDRQGLDP
jgi:hypothetical protein